MVASLGGVAERVADPAWLDECVEEVFRVMLDIESVQGMDGSSAETCSEVESVTAVIGLGGALSGACVFRCDSAAAMALAQRMTGADFDQVNDTVKDGIGELCNMVAGSWKGKFPELAARCGLSVPAVITGRDYHLHVQVPRFKLVRCYWFEGIRFSVTIVWDGLR